MGGLRANTFGAVTLLMVGAVAQLLAGGALAAENEAPRVSSIAADLAPPVTSYAVDARDPEGDALTFTWTLTGAGACTYFTPSGSRAVWQHDHQEHCPHDAGAHPGVITVVVSDGACSVTRVYEGGSAPHDPREESWDAPGFASESTDCGDDPNDAPPPVLFGEEIDCAAEAVAGGFQPVQAVWQDDPLFPDLATKRLTRLDDRSLVAELDMVATKPTLLFGLEDDSWGKIRYSGTLTGYLEVPTEVWFTVHDRSGDRVVHKHDAGMRPIRGDCFGAKPFDIPIDTSSGVPAAAFPIQAGDYTITMELVEKGSGVKVPGTAVTVSGKAVEMPPHRAYFVPVMLSGYSGGDAQGLVAAARRVAGDYAAEVPDFFPLTAGSVSVVTRPIERDMRDVFEEAKQLCNDLFARTRDAFVNCEAHAVRARVEGHMRAGGWLMGTGAGSSDGSPDRIVIWVREGDMDALGRSRAQAFAPSTKTVFVRESSDHWDVAHEIVHTLPRHLWSKTQMLDVCKRDYHNHDNWASGFRITLGGADHRQRFHQATGLMGAVNHSKTYWMEQCTYWHLLTALKTRVDPPLFAVRGVVAQGATAEAGLLDPGFTFDGSPDLVPGGEGAYAIVLKDAAGRALATHRFDLSFEDDRGEPLTIASFGFAVPRHDAAATIELTGPDGPLDARAVSAAAPRVSVRAPAAGASVTADDGIDVAWDASDADGDALTYSVFVSPDGGATWLDVVVDSNRTTARVPAALLGAAAGERALRVVATDGVRSAEATTTFRVAAADVAGEERGGIPGPAAVAALAAVGAAALAFGRRRG